MSALSLLSLIIGIVAGAAVASAVWFLAVSAKRKKREGQKRAKEEVMASVGGLLADADAYEASYRCGAITADSFSRGLIDKANAVSRLLKTNMHILDVFFVKYAERQVEEYMRMIDNPERRAEGREEADNETRFGLGSEPAAAAPAAEREEAADVTAEKQDIFDAEAERQEETFSPPPDAVGADADEGAFELPEPEAAPVPEPEESVLEDVAAEVETPPVEEEEPVFGESAAAAVPEEEQIFGVSPAAAAPEPDSWAEKSLEEFEAEFAKFEEQAAEEPSTPQEPEAMATQREQRVDTDRETGGFLVGEPAEAPGQAAGEPEPEGQEEDVFDIQALTSADSERMETQQYDRPAMMEAAAGYARPPIMPESVPPPAEGGKPASKEAAGAAEHDGITGDDVSDAIDNFFNIK